MEGGSCKSVIIIMDKQVPEFAIFQNSRTRHSAIWVGSKGKWIDAQPQEFDALQTLADTLRNAPDPSIFMEQLINQIHQIKEEDDEGIE